MQPQAAVPSAGLTAELTAYDCLRQLVCVASAGMANCARGGNRLITALVYLSDVEAGGQV